MLEYHAKNAQENAIARLNNGAEKVQKEVFYATIGKVISSLLHNLILLLYFSDSEWLAKADNKENMPVSGMGIFCF